MLENAFYESFCMLYAIYIYSRTNLGGGGTQNFKIEISWTVGF